jgi:hypothetical protein
METVDAALPADALRPAGRPHLIPGKIQRLFQ